MSGNEEQRNLQGELDEMENCEELKRQMGPPHDNSSDDLRTAAAGDQPSVATSSAATGGPSAGGGTPGVAGGAAPGSKRGEGMASGDLSLLRRLLGGNSYSRPPHIPRDPEKQVAWYRQMLHWLTNEGLEDTLTVDAVTGPVCVISSSRAVLLSQHPEKVVDDHFRSWDFIFSSVTGSLLQERLVSCTTVAEAWDALQSWVLPITSAEKSLLEAELANVQYPPRRTPRAVFREG